MKTNDVKNIHLLHSCNSMGCSDSIEMSYILNEKWSARIIEMLEQGKPIFFDIEYNPTNKSRTHAKCGNAYEECDCEENIYCDDDKISIVKSKT